VLDITGAVRISRMASGGALAVVDSGVPSAIDFAMINGVVVYGETVHDSSELLRGLLIARKPHGEIQWQACPVNPALAASVRRHGALEAHQAMRVVAAANAVYCVQPASPTIHSYGADGVYRGRFDRIPPFYRHAIDAPFTAEGIRRFQATGMATGGVWPWRTGIAIEYAVRDTTADRVRHLLFVCDSARGPIACRYTESPMRIVQYFEPDTLWGYEDATPVRGAAGGPRLVVMKLMKRP
jgi:hypothetical protein